MLVAVKTKKLVNTPLSATLAHCSVSSSLNKEKVLLSDAGEKTCLNFSKGSWIQLSTPIIVDTHNWFYLFQGSSILASVKNRFDRIACLAFARQVVLSILDNFWNSVKSQFHPSLKGGVFL